MIIDGEMIAGGILNELKIKPKPQKFLAVILVGQDTSSLSFLKQKEKIAESLGVDFRIYKFPNEIKQDPLRKEVLKIANHKTCGGVIVQLPLPEHINRHYILNVIPREKDVDVLSERALGAFYTGRNPVLPPAVGVVETILKTYNLQLTTLKTAVVGLGFLIGKPIATWLIGRCSEIYLLDIGSNLEILKQADLVITGVGKASLIKGVMLKHNTLVIDFGYSQKDGGISGDFDVESLVISRQSSVIYTPTPHGTGPILVAKLFENFFSLNKD